MALTKDERKARALTLISAAIDLILDDDAAGETAVYYSTAPGQWPRGSRSRRHARDRIRRVPGHERIGDSRSTEWRIRRETFDAATIRRPKLRSVPRVSTADDDLAEAALAGLRRTA